MEATPVIINGRDYPVKYGFAALRAFTDETNITLNQLGQIGDNMTITQALALVWAGLKDGARVTGSKFEMSIDEVADLIDKDQEALTRVLSVFQKSISQPKASKGKKKA